MFTMVFIDNEMIMKIWGFVSVTPMLSIGYDLTFDDRCVKLYLVIHTYTKEIYMSDWNDLFGAFFDKVDMDDNEKEEFIMDFYHMNKEERNDMVEEMLEIIVADMEDDFEEGFQSFLVLWEGMIVDMYNECEENEFPCLIPDNGYVLN